MNSPNSHTPLRNGSATFWNARDTVDDAPMNQLLGSSTSYRIVIKPPAGRKVFTLQTLPACEPEDPFGDTVGKAACRD